MSPLRPPGPQARPPGPSLGLTALLLACLASCGREVLSAAAAGGPALRPVRLERVPSAVAAEEIAANAAGPAAGHGRRLVRRIDLPGATGRLSGAAPRTLELPGPFPGSDPGERFDSLVLRLRCAGPDTLRVGLVRPGMRDLLPPAVELEGGERVREIAIDLDQPVDAAHPCADLTLAFVGDAAWSEVLSIDLCERTALSFLPDARSAPEWFEIEGDQRRAVRVDGEHGWHATFEASAEEFLQVTLGAPSQALARVEGSAPALSVLLQGERGTLERELEIAGAPDGSGWRTERLALATVAGAPGSPVSASFRMSAASPPTQGCALAEPFVVRTAAARRAAVPASVLLITSDTHRADYLGHARAGVAVDTPALDRLAARGVTFENCTSATNVTNPSHVAIFTATPARDTGVVDNSSPVSALAPTLAEAFRDAGYATFAAVSASQLAPLHSGLGQGFARFAAPQPGAGDAFDAIAHLERWLPEAADVPVFVWLHVFDAHAPYAPPAQLAQRYWDGSDPRRDSLPEPSVTLPHWARGVRDLDYPEAMYRAEISYLDGRLAPLLEHPRLARGVIAFTADHGEHLGQHDVWFDHRLIYPGTLRVPLILAWPDGPRGARSSAKVENMDLGRTLLDLAQLEHAPFPGRDLIASGLAGEPVEAPRYAIATYGWSASIELADGFLVLHLVDQSDQPPGLRRRRHQVELYDLASDPDCERDVLDEQPERARRLRAALIEYLGRARSEGWNLPSSAREAAFSAELEALGYADTAREVTANDWFDADCACAECARFSPR